MLKLANTEYQINEILQKRWSPRAFSETVVDKNVVLSLLEAARWAPSGNNEQPWRFIIASKQEPELYDQVLECLNENNRKWAANAPLLIVSIARLTSEKTGNARRLALFDVGLAVSNLVFQATDMGLYAHQMGGYDMDKLREQFNITSEYEPVTVIAVGYPGNADDLPGPFKEREHAPRSRKPVQGLLYTELSE